MWLLPEPGIIEDAEVSQIERAQEWAKDIIQFLKEGIIPNDWKQAAKTRLRAAKYTIVGDTLYKRCYILSFLKCISKEEGDYVLTEIQEGVCGSHSGGQILAHKAVRARYYWLRMH